MKENTWRGAKNGRLSDFKNIKVNNVHIIYAKQTIKIITIDRNKTYIFLVLFMEYNCFTNLIVHQFQLRC